MRYVFKWKSISFFFLWLWHLHFRGYINNAHGYAILPSKSFVSLRRAYFTERLRMCSQSSVIDRLMLKDNFNRWKYMQNLLNEELVGDDVNQVVYFLLKSYHNRASRKLSGVEDIVDLSPEPRAENLERLSSILSLYCNGIIPVLDEKGSPGDPEVLCLIEFLLPSLEENEDAYRGTWDTILELHGKAAVTALEGQGEASWKTAIVVAKVMIYYGFLGNDWII
jgi:hypothetical protein